jgi:hypothetical protein
MWVGGLVGVEATRQALTEAVGNVLPRFLVLRLRGVVFVFLVLVFVFLVIVG